MKKIVLLVIIIVLAVSFLAVSYLNEKVLPVKIKAALISDLAAATKKRVEIGSVKLDFFKGLVLKDVIVSDDNSAIINVKEARCRFSVLALIFKKIVISRITLLSPDIYIERRKDNSINVLELLAAEHLSSSGFKVFIRRVTVKNASAAFYDLVLEPPLSREIKKFDADVYISLPSKIRFSVNFELPSDLPIKVGSAGEWVIASKELDADIRAKDVTPAVFFRYYENAGLSIPDGRFDISANIKYKDGTLNVKGELETKSISFSKDKLKFDLGATGRFDARYNFTGRSFTYTGDANIIAMTVSGIDYLGDIEKIKGRIEFSNLGLSSDNMTAVMLGLPVEGTLKIDDPKNPALDMEISANLALQTFQEILKKHFELKIPADLKGEGKLKLAMRYSLAPGQPGLRLNGSLYMLGASALLNNGKDSLDGMTGRFSFMPNQVSWDDVGFSYRAVRYSSSGTLTNFVSPGVQFKLASKDMKLDGALALNDKMAALNAALDIDTAGLKDVFPESKEKIERAKLKGAVHADLAVKGDIKDLKNCIIDAKLSSNELSLYGFNLSNLTLNYSQKDTVGDVLFMRSFAYGGSIGMTGAIEWDKKGPPYRFDANLDGVKIEMLKNDISMKDKEISGDLKMHAGLSGVFDDISKLSGKGEITVTQGKLWQLNLFRGLGALLFTSDFGSIKFKECFADFSVHDKTISSDEVSLKSDLLDIYGPVKIGFDGVVSGVLKIEFSDKAVSDSRLKTSVAATVENYTMVALGGTVKDPKYNIRLDAANIVQSVVDNWMDR